MIRKSLLLPFILSISCFTASFTPSCWSQCEEQDDYIQALASLTFHTKQWTRELTNDGLSEDEKISFSPEHAAQLWERAGQQLCPQQKVLFEKAFLHYGKGLNAESNGNQQRAIKSARIAHRLLKAIWNQAIDGETDSFSVEDTIEDHPFLRTQMEEFDAMRHIPAKAKRLMRPHLIPDDHPMKDNLDKIFLTARATLNEKQFRKSGFETISVRPRSYVRVAKHPSLENYLVKVHLDNELRTKYHKESWEWFVRRCVGANKLREIIDRKKIKHFTVASKWLYPLPQEPAVPRSSKYRRQLCVILVTDMKLESETANLRAWHQVITHEHLDELYCCISNAKGSSYRPDNISLTQTGQFAFIDTEYPDGGPDYDRIRPYLNDSMRRYWDRLVRTGGRPERERR